MYARERTHRPRHDLSCPGHRRRRHRLRPGQLPGRNSRSMPTIARPLPPPPGSPSSITPTCGRRSSGSASPRACSASPSACRRHARLELHVIGARADDAGPPWRGFQKCKSADPATVNPAYQNEQMERAQYEREFLEAARETAARARQGPRRQPEPDPGEPRSAVLVAAFPGRRAAANARHSLRSCFSTPRPCRISMARCRIPAGCWPPTSARVSRATTGAVCASSSSTCAIRAMPRAKVPRICAGGPSSSISSAPPKYSTARRSSPMTVAVDCAQGAEQACAQKDQSS